MAEAVNSPRYHSKARPSTTTPAASTTPAMPPFLSPRLASSPRRSNAPQTPSPNYFGFQSDGSSFMSNSPNHHTKANWSPPSSTIRSAAAMSPSVVPLDQNPDFDAFRRQSEGKAFNLGGLNNFNMSMPSPRPAAGRTTTPQLLKQKSAPIDSASTTSLSNHRNDMGSSATDSSRSPKRVLSPGASQSKRRGSPPTYDSAQGDWTSRKDMSLPDIQPRYKLPLDAASGAYNNSAAKPRAETLPNLGDTDAQILATPQHVINLLESKPEQVLLLDLRVSTQYAMSHITGALNLCIPTTLLKRPSFNVQKLADTFKDDDQRAKFERWKSSSHIVVYDASSALLKDATICLNTIKKFRGEGYEGSLYIIRGGIKEFAARFPSFVESGMDAQPMSVDGDGPEIAPVIGGCPMPMTDQPANPFFGNIRQNMDLIGGVGLMPIKHPSKATKSAENEFPEWLKQASNDHDQGQRVSNKFEQIEWREKKRMEEALSGTVSFGTPKQESHDAIQIAGFEKGNKNRYNNIWPFEHSRVRLQGVPNHGCDYFNASHIKAAWSNKRYISTQAPIPATFNDFWNVVWQQDVRVVVMLTAEKEGAQVKAHNYWDSKQYGSLHLDFLSEKRASIEPSRIHKHQKRPSTGKRSATQSQNPQVPLAQIDGKDKDGGEEPFVIVRKFTISHDRYPFEPMREITQLQYSSWPDFGAPAHPAHLLGLVEQCDAVVRATNKAHAFGPDQQYQRPILVHCSAGCGRTGTFCTVDSVIDMLKQQRKARKSHLPYAMEIDKSPSRVEEDNFFATRSSVSDDSKDGAWMQRDDLDLVEKVVEDFRHQRISMVQSLRQYVLCYESVMEWLVDHREDS
ncbi:related to tyrosine-protein phosphatase non-receptor type 12 [Ramularia collo-cygni]|uniref:protein-tyrosine-phosphatase n=1 Tax=Ramularia collo-cygni TaxID=112498 RepID=A0A2D3UPG0_9PEZI|nr:related to tyrosine-protein phosphatase non-receptor type 12 [Ramularia collo-cygni]CZT15788.1 related to tyrosine-protein phosphatase non-receptor type 12 [Ramularia collo-cygni]